MDNTSLFAQAQELIPGGVNSPVRAFKAVGGTPKFFRQAAGAYLEDVEGKRYIDYIGSWGPMILGHSDPDVVAAIQAQVMQGISFGAPSPLEVAMAKKVTQMLPSLEKVRFVNSGTEATMSAIRLARGYTGRNTFIKFDGCYHGHADSLLVKAGSGTLTYGAPSSPGVPLETTKHTLTLEYNNLEQLEQAFQTQGSDIAAVILEPIAGNMNMVRPTATFLKALREWCTQQGTVLIFDEVMTGFRVHMGGAQTLYGIQPDLTTLGKVIGGGMPVGAFGGRAEIMRHLSPEGAIYQAGTLSGNPVAMAAGLATLTKLEKPGLFAEISQTTQTLMQGLKTLADHYSVPFEVDYEGGMFGFFFTSLGRLPQNLADVQQGDLKRFNAFFHHMLAHGIYLAPSFYEAGFVSWQHREAEVERTLRAAEAFFKQA